MASVTLDIRTKMPRDVVWLFRLLYPVTNIIWFYWAKAVLIGFAGAHPWHTSAVATPTRHHAHPRSTCLPTLDVGLVLFIFAVGAQQQRRCNQIASAGHLVRWQTRYKPSTHRVHWPISFFKFLSVGSCSVLKRQDPAVILSVSMYLRPSLFKAVLAQRVL